ncbi:MAG: membrane dipeptidase [Candidatus Bipolaricaulota bacterium]|nr:MAG: membrane dipeptidase [Candidatus Bipolaricaulota bacterium]
MSSPLPLFDAHCDTILKIVDCGEDLFDEGADMHITLPGLRRAGVRAQLFACFVLSERHPGTERERALVLLDRLAALAATNPDDLRLVVTARDLSLGAEGAIGMILGLEGADPLEGSAAALRDFFDRGVRLVIPAWKDNPFSGTAFGANSGLSRVGRELVAIAEELGVVVDVSHLSDRAFADVLEVSTRPFVASHSNCRALCPSLRNLTDAMIRDLADRGGVLGVNFFPGFLDPTFRRDMEERRDALRLEDVQTREERFRAWISAAPRPRIDWIARHVLHAIDTGGEDCVGLGADLDGVTSLPTGIDSASDLATVPPLLTAAGLSTRQVEKVCWENMHRIFSEVLPAA